ncbi:hypothetical protein ACP70R_029091 [Stipagrostis hirtigluma subsp. patula]
MEVSTTVPLLLLCAAISLSLPLLHHVHGRKNQKTGRLPPGPPALLFLAKFLASGRSIYDVASPLLRDLHARYGPVVSLRLANTHVFVADRRLAHRMLVQGGATFADRPPAAEPRPLFTAGGRDISGSSHGSYWRLVRRNLAGKALHPSCVGLFAPARRSACDALVRSLRERGANGEPVTLRPLLRRAMFELLVYMCFGVQLGQGALDEIVELQHRVVLSLTDFPIFAFFPAVTKRLFRRRWAAYVAERQMQEELFVPLIHATRGGGGDPPCYADSLLSVRVADEGDRPLTDAEMVSLCSEFLNGGTDTVLAVTEWIMAELVNHPDVQAKLYEEVSAKPELNDGDIQAMPYLKVVVLEGLRLHPPTHFILPHSSQRGADIGGYTVPKGADVNFMVAEIGRDETVWTAAREFRPERFLDGGEGQGVDITGSREIKMMPFGAGRRMCPGYSLGIHHAEYFVARMVKELEWLPPVGNTVVDMTEELEFTVMMKHPLRARVLARN